MTTPSPSTPEQSAELEAFRPSIAFLSYYVHDIERALRFYVGVLGMKEQMRVDLPGGEHEVVLGYPDTRGAGLLLMWKEGRREPYDTRGGYSRYVLRVTDVDGAIERLKAKGVPVTVPPTDAGSLRFAMIQDPDGYAIELLQVRRS